MAERRSSSRRDFLTGRAVRHELRNVGDELADAVIDAGERERPVPVGQETIRLETSAMACSWGVFMNPGSPRQVMVASDALDIVHHVEHLLTVYRDDSEVAQLNRAAHDGPQTVSQELLQLLCRNRSLWEATGGAFDPATGALIQVWRAARREGKVPDEDDVRAALARCGMQYVRMDEAAGTVAFDLPGLLLDFGASGKGEAIDRAAAHLAHEDVGDYLVHGGHSSLRARGDHGGLGGWPVGIKNPLFTHKRYATVLLQDRSMSTSGSNIQYFRHQGKRYGHILDPRTGWPAETLLSVTVLAPTALEADVLSTAFYVMGLDNALKYCEDRPDIGAILIPVPASGGRLEPIVCNVPQGALYFENV